MTATILEKIKAYKLDEIAARKRARSYKSLEDDALAYGPARGFEKAIRAKIKAGDYALIAEIKKASPSKGLIRADFNPPKLAEAYATGGAACLSVLTDAPSFQGHEDFLIAARAACELPALRKDFIYDVYQVAEARAIGADCILIIMASVSDGQAQELEAAAFEMGMDVLLETHNRAELDRALELKSPLMGVNNRDLHSFVTDLATTETLAPHIPDERVIVTESGIFTNDDMTRMSDCGAQTFLIGEALMRQDDVAKATAALLQKQEAQA